MPKTIKRLIKMPKNALRESLKIAKQIMRKFIIKRITLLKSTFSTLNNEIANGKHIVNHMPK